MHVYVCAMIDERVGGTEIEAILAPLLTLSLPAIAYLLPFLSLASGFVGLSMYIRVQDTRPLLAPSFSGGTLQQLFTSALYAIVRVHQLLAKETRERKFWLSLLCVQRLEIFSFIKKIF